MNNVLHKFFSMYLFLFITLYMFRAHRAHHQERHIVSIQPPVTVILYWLLRCVQMGRWLLLPTCTHLGHQHRMTVTRGCVDTICHTIYHKAYTTHMHPSCNGNSPLCSTNYDNVLWQDLRPISTYFRCAPNGRWPSYEGFFYLVVQLKLLRIIELFCFPWHKYEGHICWHNRVGRVFCFVPVRVKAWADDTTLCCPYRLAA